MSIITKPTPPEPSGETQFTIEELDYLLSFIRHDLSERTSVNGTFDQSVPWGDGNVMRQSLINRLETALRKARGEGDEHHQEQDSPKPTNDPS